MADDRWQNDGVDSSTSTSDESRQRLLHGEGSNDGKQEYYADQDDNSLGPYQTCSALNRWWKLVIFLILWVVLLPLIVKLSLSFKSTDRLLPTFSASWSRSPDDYILDKKWDFDAAPQVREYSWTIEDAIINPDGVFRPMLLVNGQFPGPLVRVNEGDTIRVHVINKAINATALHWHGLYQNGSNHMDGTVGITQCPIAPGRSFTYEFKVERQAGTYWYHGHHGMQASDGLYGPLIIHGRNEKHLQKLDYASDRIIMLSDHYHDSTAVLTQLYLAPDRENAEPVPDGALINGRGLRDCSALLHRRCDNTTSGAGVPDLNLANGKSHRLRIINVGAFAEFQFQIDEHELAITEVDGTDVWPLSYHRLNINPAQRYSVVVTANSSTSDSFWMRARMITTCFAEPHPFMEADVNVVVRYRMDSDATSSAPTLPISVDWQEALALECRDLNTTELVPVNRITAPAAEDAFYYIRSNFEIGAYRLSRGFFNSSSFRPNHRSPSLFRTVDGLASSNKSFDGHSNLDHAANSSMVNTRAFESATELVVQTRGVQTIDLLIHNFDDGNHPMHLHGYKFFVLAQGHGAPPRLDKLRGPDRANIQPLYDSLNLTNPLRRDTASVEAYGWVLIRFVADNPGMWAFHCHVGWHAEAGLVMQFLTMADKVKTMEIPVAMRVMCAAEGADKGRSPSDQEIIEEEKARTRLDAGTTTS